MVKVLPQYRENSYLEIFSKSSCLILIELAKYDPCDKYINICTNWGTRTPKSPSKGAKKGKIRSNHLGSTIHILDITSVSSSPILPNFVCMILGIRAFRFVKMGGGGEEETGSCKGAKRWENCVYNLETIPIYLVDH